MGKYGSHERQRLDILSGFANSKYKIMQLINSPLNSTPPLHFLTSYTEEYNERFLKRTSIYKYLSIIITVQAKSACKVHETL
jgi:hypothetical protein